MQPQVYSAVLSFIDWLYVNKRIDVKVDFEDFCKQEYKTINTDIIFVLAADAIGSTVEKIKSKSRHREFVWGRKMVSSYLFKNGYTLSSIARMLGKRNHTSIIYFIKEHHNMLLFDKPYAALNDRFLKSIAINYDRL